MTPPQLSRTADQRRLPPALTIHTQRFDDGHIVVRPTGDLDAFTVEQLRRGLTEIAGCGRAVIDLSAVTFMDSSGLTTLIGGIRRSTALGGRVALACSRPGLARVLHATRLDSIATIADTLDAATRLLDPSAAADQPGTR